MSLTQKELLHLAKLSALEFSEEELKKLHGQIENTIDSFKVIDKFVSEEDYRSWRVLNAENELRADFPKESIKIQDIELNAPDFFEGAIVVHTVVE